ncbi:MAG: EamA family transporter [Actinomycetota bacterium]|nr:EamA family transporter [Actinomycetota bacterium]
MSHLSAQRADPPVWLFWSALWVIYIVWGSTYLAIRVTVETIPPMASAGVRFLVAGALMYGFLLIRRGPQGVRVTLRELGACALIGGALLFGGNGVVAVAEQTVPSALTALIIAAIPLWVIVLRAVTGDRVSRGTALGVVFGFGGVALLVVPGSTEGGGEGIGYLLLVVASFSWASGSFLSGKLPLPKDPFTSTAVQMLCGGAILTVAAAVGGEFSGMEPASFSVSSIAALAYLVVFGSLLAFTAYTWLLQNGPISKISTYAYVNPVVAVFLGWLILSEEITLMIGIGALLIVTSVAFIVRNESRVARRDAAAAPPVPVATYVDPELERAR